MSSPAPRFVAVDWGTTRLRASLIGDGGAVLGRTQSDLGVQSVPAGGFPAALGQICAPWFEAHPRLPVIMAGMVGSRNGWIEAPYLHCPCGPKEAAAALTAIPDLGREVLLVPGVDTVGSETYDVMRGEETQAFGAGVPDGIVCLPGTHSKWVEMRGGRMVRFWTYITGELYAAMVQSFVGRLAEDPEDIERGWTAAARLGADAAAGLSHTLFQARTQVLRGTMPPGAVRPFLSRLLVEAELNDVSRRVGRPSRVHLVAAEPQLGLYARAFGARGLDVSAVDPAAATLQGLQSIMSARRTS